MYVAIAAGTAGTERPWRVPANHGVYVGNSVAGTARHRTTVLAVSFLIPVPEKSGSALVRLTPPVSAHLALRPCTQLLPKFKMSKLSERRKYSSRASRKNLIK
jgi:hypothetical protein